MQKISESYEQQKLNLLLSLLFSIQKSQKNCYYRPLLEKFKEFNEQCQLMIIIGLGPVIDKIKSEVTIPEELSEYLNYVTQENKKKVNNQFVAILAQNELTFCVSSQAAKIIYHLLTEKSKITETVVDNLLKAIESEDYLTQLFAAKALSEVLEYEDKILLKVQDKVDPKYQTEFSLYCNLIYINALNIKSIKFAINEIHIQRLSRLFPFQEIIIQDEKPLNIEQTILIIFSNQSNLQQQEFDTQVFEIFNQLFNTNQDIKKALDIIYNYTKNKNKIFIPQETIFAIENQLDIADDNANNDQKFSNKQICFKILKKIIKKGKKVSEKTLEYLLSNLDEDEAQYKKAYKILEQVELNQELSEKVFTVLQMERVGYVLKEQKQDENDINPLVPFVIKSCQIRLVIKSNN